MHYLVTGGGGFIGSHLVDRLLLDEHTVTVVDDFSTGSPTNLPASPNVRVITKDAFDVDGIDLKAGVDGIAHLAALPSVNQSWENVLDAHHRNLTTTLRMLAFCGEFSVPRFVFASSAAVYGDPEAVPVKESHATRPQSPYGVQKLASEYYGRLLGKKLGFNFVSLRLFNVYGSRQPANSPYSGVVSRFLSSAQRDLPITIYGDGSQTRDFVHVEDVAAAFAAALAAPPREVSLVCNIGTQEATSIRKLAEIIYRRISTNGVGPQIRTSQRLPGDITDSQADISIARSRLQFVPKYSFEDGLAKLAASGEKFL